MPAKTSTANDAAQANSQTVLFALRRVAGVVEVLQMFFDRRFLLE
jgi:hypothetical protein